MNGKRRCLATLAGEEPDRVPVFPLLMGFSAKLAGRSYAEFASDGHVMADSQMLAHETFDIDAITACSDAFRIVGDLGGELVFPEDKAPYSTRPLIGQAADLDRLKRPDVAKRGGRMADRVLATRLMAQGVGDECLVLGWVDMPFAEACSACGVSEFMLLMMDEPLLAHRILAFLSDIVAEFAVAQIEAGAPMIGAGDAAASLISPEMYREFALPYQQRVIDAVHAAGGTVKLHMCGNTIKLLDDMITSGADLFNVDNLVDLSLARNAYASAGKAFKGNVDPVWGMLFATPEECQARAIDCMSASAGTKYFLGLGCEVPRDVPHETFRAFCAAPEAYRSQPRPATADSP
ncbi:MAG: uroporphyrinogen decarboxylase family protein [Actinomycetia bacterium]|nr:uroporphyrinogen decarboxylase family protein [Actinomycetes bacterium]